MLDIENLLSNMQYHGTMGNIKEPKLELCEIDCKQNILYFKLAYDYSSNFSYDIDDMKKLISIDAGLKISDEDNFDCYLEVSKEELIELVSQVVIFCFLKDKSIYKKITLEKNNLNSNVGKCCYTLSFELQNYKIPVSVQVRKKVNEDIDDLNAIFNKFCKYAKELEIVEEVSSAIMKEKGIVSGDINNLCECFDYDVVDDCTVVLHLKNFINPKYLFRFKGFNAGYTDFKICEKDYNGTFSMVKGDDYHTIQWGNHVTCCADYFWDMRDAIIECIRIKKLMF